MTDDKQQKIISYAKQCRVTVFGGISFRDEAPILDKTNRPHLGIEFPEGTFACFKMTSVNKKNKAKSIGRQYYALKDPKAVELDHTFHNLMANSLSACVDLNHTVRLLNGDTPPLKLYHDTTSRRWYNQTHFEVSDRDKIGIIEKLYQNIRWLRKPECSEIEYQKAEKQIINSGKYHPYYQNVVPKLDLNISGLDENNQSLSK